MAFQTGLVKLLHMSEGREHEPIETYVSAHDRQMASGRIHNITCRAHRLHGGGGGLQGVLEDKPGALVFLSIPFCNL